MKKREEDPQGKILGEENTLSIRERNKTSAKRELPSRARKEKRDAIENRPRRPLPGKEDWCKKRKKGKRISVSR